MYICVCSIIGDAPVLHAGFLNVGSSPIRHTNRYGNHGHPREAGLNPVIFVQLSETLDLIL